MYCLRRFYIILLLLAAMAPGYSQAPYNFYQLFLDRGLSDPRVNAIVQDKHGYMWFGTPNGLNRYDGYSIQPFYADREQKWLPSNNILSLHSGSSGELWIGTAAGLVKFDFIRQQFVHMDTTEKAGADIDRTAINDIEEDFEGNTWVAGTSGLYCYLAKEKRWENMTTLLNLPRLRFCRKLKFLDNETLYVASTGNMPFYSLNTKSNRVDSIPYKTVYEDTCCLNIFSIEKLNEEELAVGFLSIGVSKLNVRTKEYSILPGVLGKTDSIRYNTVYDILKDHAGRVWMASYYFSLTEFIPAENRIVPLSRDPYNPYGLEGSALCLYEDRRHNIWVGTAAKGVYRFNPSNTSTRFYPQHDFLPGSLQRGLVLSLLPMDANTLMVGTEKGPSFYDYNTKKYTNYKGMTTIGINGPVEQVQVGYRDSAGILWMGSNRLGLMRFDPVKKSFQNFSRITGTQPLHDDGITDILPLPDEKLLMLGYSRPVIFDKRTFNTTSYRNDSTNAMLKLTGLTNIIYDAQQMIWIAGANGKLYEYNPVNKELSDRSEWLSSVKMPLTIYKMVWHEEKLWLATSRGLISLRKNEKPVMANLNLANPSLNEIKGLLPVGDWLWFCNNRMIGKLNTRTGATVLLGEKEGLANVQLLHRSLARSAQGTILIGSNKGYYEIFDDKLKAANGSIAATPFLTGFRIYDKQLQTDRAISDLESIRLKYDQNFFSFDISAFEYDEAEDIEYAYMLEGFDKDWQYLGTKRSGSYTNVPGGTYTLKLRARTSTGEWNESGQQVKVFISKPFWKTWWFRILVVSLVVMLTWLYYRSRVNRIRKEAQLRSDYEIRLNELENSALRTQMNPHFIFNSLNTINSFINSNDRVQANQYISKFSRLVRLILDHSREKKIILKDELEVAELYMQLEQIRFENKFQYNIDVTDLDTSAVEVPPLIIQPFVENAILHGLLPADKPGILTVRISKQGEFLMCSIEDNGVGRVAAKKIRERSGYNRKSHGMEITLKRIELFNKENGLTRDVEIVDRYAPDGSPAGTSINILLVYAESF